MPAASTPTGAGTQALLVRLARPHDPAQVAALLLGLPLRSGRQLVGTVLATSEEAAALLEALPHMLRTLAIASSDRPERVHGELRGPVLWSETMSARSASACDPGLFVCSTTSRAYDTDENRVLKAALHRIERAGIEAAYGLDAHGHHAVQVARHNGHQARRFLGHRTLTGVPLVRVTGRALRRTRTGRRAGTYAPALAVLSRAAEPLRVEHLRAYMTRPIAADHDLVATALGALDERSGEPSYLRVSHGALQAGPVRYRHDQGVTIGGVPVRGPEDIDAALDRSGT